MGPALGRWKGAFTGGRIDAFTFIELLIMIMIIGILSGIAVPIYGDFRYQAQVAAAKGIIREIEVGVNAYYYHNGTYPATLSDVMESLPLDPWGNPYQYLSSTDHAWNGSRRKDRQMNPLNDDFDLYSMGADGLSKPPLTNPQSQDDVVRAGNGSFVDLAALY